MGHCVKKLSLQEADQKTDGRKRESEREDAGIVVFKHYGVNQNKELVAEIERTALIKKKSHWIDR